MKEIPFKSKFDLIFSSFDSINYLLSKQKVLQHFKQVKNILSDDGIFSFDTALESNSYKHQKTALNKG